MTVYETILAVVLLVVIIFYGFEVRRIHLILKMSEFIFLQMSQHHLILVSLLDEHSPSSDSKLPDSEKYNKHLNNETYDKLMKLLLKNSDKIKSPVED